MKNKLLNVLKVAISLGLIAFIFTRPEIRNVDWSTVLSELRFWPWLLGVSAAGIVVVCCGHIWAKKRGWLGG